MKISREEIQHIANLAHINLSIDELQLYQEQLEDILDYVKQLGEVDTDKVEITAQVNGLNNVWREDIVKEWSEDEINLALSQGKTKDRYIKVKKVL